VSWPTVLFCTSTLPVSTAAIFPDAAGPRVPPAPPVVVEVVLEVDGVACPAPLVLDEPPLQAATTAAAATPATPMARYRPTIVA
jgi:hypothetical protein